MMGLGNGGSCAVLGIGCAVRRCVALVLACALSCAAMAGQLGLAWNASTDPNVTGYYLYYGTTSRNYPSRVQVGASPNFTVSSLNEGQTYYFAVTAHNAALSESAYSEEVNATVPASPASTTGIASSANPANPGTSVMFTASVSGASPTGTVEFKNGSTIVSGCAAVALGGSGSIRTASCTSAALGAGTHSIVARYSGDGGNGASASPALAQVIKASSATTVASSVNPSIPGGMVTFNATVTGLLPAGSVDFRDGATSIPGCAAVALAGAGNTRTASCSVSTLTVGTHSVAAHYSGDAINVQSATGPFSQYVNAGPPQRFFHHDLPSNYACDQAAALVGAPRTSRYAVVPYLRMFLDWSLTKEQWQVDIAGQQDKLNVVIAKPSNATSPRGIVIVGHGHSPLQAADDPMNMVDHTLVSEMTQRGLIVFFVARRGNYGSTGERLVTFTSKQISEYNSGALVYADLLSLAAKFQSDSLVAALDQKIANDAQYRSLLGTVLLIGASDGADTVMQTAADSTVFKAATSKAIIRITGLDSARDTSSDALPGMSQFAARLAPALVPSLWLGGEADSTTSPAQLSCMFNAFQSAASYTNTFYLVPGIGHFGLNEPFTQTLRLVTTQYLVSRGIYAEAAGVPDHNQHGLTGSYYEPATAGQGFELEVFPDSSAPGVGLAFASWFTYDSVAGGAERQRWYTLSGPVLSGDPHPSLTIYQNTGGNFNAPPTTTSNAVGTATLTFDSCTSGLLSYFFSTSGRTGSIPLTRLTQNVTCSTTSARSTNADFAFSGNWFDPATSGQGITVEVNPMSRVLFFAWYTYSPGGAGAGAAGQRWYTGQQTSPLAPGSRTIPVLIYETTEGWFDAPTTPAQTTVVVGSGTLAFQSCSAATLTYTFSGGSSSGSSETIELRRAGPVPPGCTQ